MSDVNDDCVGKTSALWNGVDIRENRNEPKRSLPFTLCDLTPAVNEMGFSLIEQNIVKKNGDFCAPLKVYMARDSKYGFIAGWLVDVEINKQTRLLSGCLLLNEQCLIPLTDIIHEGDIEITFTKSITYANGTTSNAKLHVDFCWYPKVKSLKE